MAAHPESGEAQTRKPPQKRRGWGGTSNEAALYTHVEDKGGWGIKNSFLREAIDSTNQSKHAWKSKTPRFETEMPLVDKMYDIDTGSGHQRTVGLSVKESQRRYGAVFNDTKRWEKDHEPATSAIYTCDKNSVHPTVSHSIERTPRKYFGQFHSVVERGYDPRDGDNGQIPDYDHGDGPRNSFQKNILTSPRKYAIMSSQEERGPEVERQVEPVYDYDTDVGRAQTLARGVELSAVEYANMRSKVPRFEASQADFDNDFEAQDYKTLNQSHKETPRVYNTVSTKTPRFKLPNRDGLPGGQDFYQVDTAHKKSLGTNIKTHPIKYRSTLGSKTARFSEEETGYGAKEGGDPDGMNYNTDTAGKTTLRTQIMCSPRKYSQFRSKVPRFNSDSTNKKKGKKLDMDAVYEAELKRVTGVREAAEYYIPNYGSHRGVYESVKRSKVKYASSFGSRVDRWAEE